MTMWVSRHTIHVLCGWLWAFVIIHSNQAKPLANSHLSTYDHCYPTAGHALAATSSSTAP